MSSGALKSPSYMPQLDGLRAICVCMVFVAHWLPGSMQGGVPWGSVGVNGFFVLSGFLITGILLDMRDESTAPRRIFWERLKIFMIRRGLRIFPAYFLLLVAMWILGDASVRAYAPWCFTYTVNFLVWRMDGWVGTISHLWSLAVEEQFYMVWPLLMLAVPWRRLLWVLLFAFLGAVAIRTAFEAWGGHGLSVRMFPLSLFDFFAAGGISAWVKRNHAPTWRALASYGGWFAAFFACLLVGGWIFQWQGFVWRVADSTLEAVAWALVIISAAHGVGGMIGKALMCRPLAWFGQISYGLYLIHNFMPNAIGRLCALAGISGWNELNPVARFAVLFLGTTLAASLSYYLIEKPCLSLKDRWGRYAAQVSSMDVNCLKNNGSV